MSKAGLDELASAIVSGDKRSLSRGITLVESQSADDTRLAGLLLAALENKTKMVATTIAVTGPPGAGKSTFIESMGKRAIANGHRVAVLSIDPTSEISGGSILADKTRMPKLSLNQKAFIRPSPSGGELGGINRRTLEVKKVCEAAGYNLIFIETVGVGQSESEVVHLVDMVTVLLQPGSGDDLQGIKKGLNEKADYFVVNKADGNQIDLAREAKSFMLSTSKWAGQSSGAKYVVLHSHIDEQLADKCWEKLIHRCEELAENGTFEQRRTEQIEYWFYKKSEWALLDWIKNQDEYKITGSNFMKKIKNGELKLHEGVTNFIEEVKKKLGQ